MLNKYKEIYDIYGLTNAQIEMNTGLSAKEFINRFDNPKTVSLDAIIQFTNLYDIDRKFLNLPSFISGNYEFEKYNISDSILKQEMNFLKYVDYFHHVFSDYLNIPMYEVSFSEFIKEHKKRLLSGMPVRKNAAYDREMLVEVYESNNISVLLENMGIHIMKRSILKYGISSYHIWINKVPYIVVDRDVNYKARIIAKELRMLMGINQNEIDELTQYVDEFSRGLRMTKDSQDLFEIFYILKKDDVYLIDSVMKEHGLSEKFLYKLFNFDESTMELLEKLEFESEGSE
ncbi:hypothetical protein [Mammaliicoccus sciuri]|uniref:hypothetical protein n=1 Tax=Mammaliicoccus sciuri TaxID=1296 RepID=UPI002DB817BF|nr:hypothetical protein [Mammaliicoccus sciuri]MEB8265407.1 hypothetical protein [Mammaliicoccus sciuri]